MKLLVIAAFIFAVGALTVSRASVLRDERAVQVEEEHGSTRAPPIPSSAKQICARYTPCAWSMYKPVNKFIEANITNIDYCECAPGLECIIDEDDTSANAYVYRCRSPQKNDTTAPERS